ncbi:MAG: sigma-70 family RNA polymerase sigma factor [Bacteroidota bacterium]
MNIVKKQALDDYTDKELLEKFRDVETQHYAFNLLVKKYSKRVYLHVRKIVIDHDDTNDVVQNTFIKVWKNLADFREDSQLFTWLYRIATNEALSFLKQKKTKFLVPFGDVEYELSNSLTTDSNFSGDKIQLKLQRAILTLPEKQRLVFNMKYFDDLKYEEIAEILNLTVGGLKASYHHAVKKIEKYLEEN